MECGRGWIGREGVVTDSEVSLKDLFDAFASSLGGLDVSGLARADRASSLQANSRRSTDDLEAVLGLSAAGAASAFSDIIETNTRKVTEAAY